AGKGNGRGARGGLRIGKSLLAIRMQPQSVRLLRSSGAPDRQSTICQSRGALPANASQSADPACLPAKYPDQSTSRSARLRIPNIAADSPALAAEIAP